MSERAPPLERVDERKLHCNDLTRRNGTCVMSSWKSMPEVFAKVVLHGRRLVEVMRPQRRGPLSACACALYRPTSFPTDWVQKESRNILALRVIAAVVLQPRPPRSTVLDRGCEKGAPWKEMRCMHNLHASGGIPGNGKLRHSIRWSVLVAEKVEMRCICTFSERCLSVSVHGLHALE